MPSSLTADAIPRARALWGKTRRALRRDEASPTRLSFYEALWRSAATATGAEYVDLTEGFGALRHGDRTLRVYGPLLGLDDPVTLELAGHKSVALALLRSAGVPTTVHVAVDGGDLGKARRLLAAEGRVVVKPQSRTGGGAGVVTNVTDERQLRRAIREASSHGGGGVGVEPQVAGDSHRLLYLDGELLDVVVRKPAHVVGDGRRSIRTLVRSENARRRALGDDSTGSVSIGLELSTTMASQGRSPRDVPAAGEVVQVSGRSNTGDLESSRSVLSECCAEVRAVGALAAGALRVRLAGVDLITSDISQPLEMTGGVVNEVNSTPGIHWHYLLAADSPRVPVAELIVARVLGITTYPLIGRG
jgi:D-alanine-D-alanine ligase-like ATP-grasp enzyme